MSIHFQINIEGETTDEAIAEFRKVFGALLGAEPAARGLTAGVLNKIAEGGPGNKIVERALDEVEVEIIPPAKKTRKTKDKAPEAVENGEVTKDRDAPLAGASSVGTTESASTSSTTEASSPSVSDASSVSIDDLRAKLMSLSKTDGGHDKVFDILGKFGAKNASTVPEDKRGEVVALVDEALAGAK